MCIHKDSMFAGFHFAGHLNSFMTAKWLWFRESWTFLGDFKFLFICGRIWHTSASDPYRSQSIFNTPIAALKPYWKTAALADNVERTARNNETLHHQHQDPRFRAWFSFAFGCVKRGTLVLQAFVLRGKRFACATETHDACMYSLTAAVKILRKEHKRRISVVVANVEWLNTVWADKKRRRVFPLIQLTWTTLQLGFKGKFEETVFHGKKEKAHRHYTMGEKILHAAQTICCVWFLFYLFQRSNRSFSHTRFVKGKQTRLFSRSDFKEKGICIRFCWCVFDQTLYFICLSFLAAIMNFPCIMACDQQVWFLDAFIVRCRCVDQNLFSRKKMEANNKVIHGPSGDHTLKKGEEAGTLTTLQQIPMIPCSRAVSLLLNELPRHQNERTRW